MLSHNGNNLVDKFVGSAYDKVKLVADNIDKISTWSDKVDAIFEDVTKRVISDSGSLGTTNPRIYPLSANPVNANLVEVFVSGLRLDPYEDYDVVFMNSSSSGFGIQIFKDIADNSPYLFRYELPLFGNDFTLSSNVQMSDGSSLDSYLEERGAGIFRTKIGAKLSVIREERNIIFTLIPFARWIRVEVVGEEFTSLQAETPSNNLFQDKTGAWWKLDGSHAVDCEVYGMYPENEDNSEALTNFMNDPSSTILNVRGFSYNFKSEVEIKSNKMINVVPGLTEFIHSSETMFTGENVENFVCSHLTLRSNNPSPQAIHFALKLSSHKFCNFSNMTFIGYADSSIMLREPKGNTGVTHNDYSNWYIEGCQTIDTAIGREGLNAEGGVPCQYVHDHNEDGPASVFNTGILWPEQYKSSVVVLRRNSKNVIKEVDPSEYDVSYPAGLLTVDMKGVFTTNHQQIRIYPSQPIKLNHLPISNNRFNGMRAQYVFSRGKQDIRYTDSELLEWTRLLAANDYVKLIATNPYIRRTGEAGDNMRLTNGFMSWRSELVTLPGSIVGCSFGNGTKGVGGNISFDFNWEENSVWRGVQFRDNAVFELTGNFTTAIGSFVITGVGHLLDEEFSRVGSIKDDIIINGEFFNVSDFDPIGGTVTVTIAPTFAGTFTAYAYNPKDKTTIDLTIPKAGTDDNGLGGGQLAKIEYGSCTDQSGVALVPDGQTYVLIQHDLWKAPTHVMLSAMSDLGANSRLWATTPNATTIRINLSGATAGDKSIAWTANAPIVTEGFTL